MEMHSKNKQCHTHNNKYTYLSLHQLTICSSGLCQATGLCLALCRKAFHSVWFTVCVQMQFGHRAIMANLWLFGPLVSWSVGSIHMCVVCACVCCEYVCMWKYVCVCACMCECVCLYIDCVYVSFVFECMLCICACMHACVCACVCVCVLPADDNVFVCRFISTISKIHNTLTDVCIIIIKWTVNMILNSTMHYNVTSACTHLSQLNTYFSFASCDCFTVILSRNQPEPASEPSWLTFTVRRWPRSTASSKNTSC